MESWKNVFCFVFLFAVIILLINITMECRGTDLWTHIKHSYQEEVYVNSNGLRVYNHREITGRETIHRNVTTDVSGTVKITDVNGMSFNTDANGTKERNSQSHTTRLLNDPDRISNDTVDTFLYDTVTVYQAAKSIHDARYTRKMGDRCLQRLPQCIIIGSFKAGTREIIDFMAMHPNIIIKTSPIYELNYFSNDSHFRDKLHISYDELRSEMPCSFKDQITVFKHPGYFEDHKVPERLYRYNRELKMILLVREPVERLISHVTFESNMEKVQPQQYMNAIVREGRVSNTHFLVRQSIYDESWKRYLEYFHANQILILEDKELRYDPANVLRRVEHFLGLPNFITNDDFVYNVNKQFYCVKLNDKGYCYGNDRGRTQKLLVLPQTMNLLTEFYKPHNQNFFAMINRTFDW